MPSAVELSCPHYPPAGATGPNWVCRGCGSLVANSQHASNQALGFTANTILSRPEVRSVARKVDRKG